MTKHEIQVSLYVLQGAVSENCLFLTVQVPSEYKYDPNNLLPVMIWIYGGGFAYGSHGDRLYVADNLSNSTGTIIVSMNYRIGDLTTNLLFR